MTTPRFSAASVSRRDFLRVSAIAGGGAVDMAGASTQMATVKVRVPREGIAPGTHKIRFVVEAQDDAHVAVDEKSVFIVRQ